MLSGIHYTNGFIKPFPLLQKRYLLFQNPPILSAMNGWPFGVAGTITVNQEVTFDLHLSPMQYKCAVMLFICTSIIIIFFTAYAVGIS